MSEPTKTMATIELHVATLVAEDDTPDGPRKTFYWYATGDPDEFIGKTADEIANTKELHGPFDTEAEAQADAKIALVGDAEATHGDMWDLAWEKKH
jgi:hypothetical protein